MSDHKDIHAAVAVVYAEVGYVQKGGRVDGASGGYRFAGEADILSVLRPALVTAGLTVHVVSYEDVAFGTYPTKSGGVMHTASCRATVRFTHAASGTYFDVQALGFGADSGDKAIPKCQTIAFKYALRQTFALETGDDPDKDASVERAAPRTPPGRADAPAGTSGRTATGNDGSGHARPLPGASAGAAPIPPCSLCGGAGEANPGHERNEKAPEFRCAGTCEDAAKSPGGRAFRHGFNRATEAQIKSASASLSAIARALEARSVAKADVDIRIRDWLAGIGVPRSRTAWSRDHASRALDALKGEEFIIEDLAAGRGDAYEPPEDDAPARDAPGPF